jgi:2'-5' RNA ligase
MRAAFALLASAEIHNVVRKLAWKMHVEHRTGTRHASLPPHVSLKQPFRIADLDFAAFETYTAEFAASIEPVDITLTELQVMGAEEGILWAAVEGTAVLHGLHERLNRELSEWFGDTSAPFDGPEYLFHLTVIMGGRPAEVYRTFLHELGDPRLDLRFTARELAIFVYDEAMGPEGNYMSYKVLPLGRPQP